MAKLVSQVYAEALFGLGVENGLLDTLCLLYTSDAADE